MNIESKNNIQLNIWIVFRLSLCAYGMFPSSVVHVSQQMTELKPLSLSLFLPLMSDTHMETKERKHIQTPSCLYA